MATQKPKPETTRAFLISGGFSKPTFTTHHFYETRPARLRTGELVWEFTFRCFKTGAVRRWGYQERLTMTEEEQAEAAGREAN